MHSTLMLQIAYALLTCAFCSSVAVAAARYEQHDNRYPVVSGLLFATIVANLRRTLLSPVDIGDPIALFEYRALFLVWPFGTLFVLLYVFDKQRCAGALISFTGACVMALGIFPDSLDGVTSTLAQCAGIVSSTCAVWLLVGARKRQPIVFKPEEIAACFCAVAEGAVAVVGYLLPRTWWPAIAIYCVLYVALILHHARTLWTARTLPILLRA